MADDQRKPWVLPVFFGLLIVLFWLVTDLMKPPSAAVAPPPPAVEETPAVETESAGPAALSPAASAE